MRQRVRPLRSTTLPPRSAETGMIWTEPGSGARTWSHHSPDLAAEPVADAVQQHPGAQ